MNYNELVVSVLLKEELPYRDSYYHLSSLINQAMFSDNRLKEVHTNKTAKMYTFSSLYPVEKTKCYQKGRVYIFRLRSIDKSFITHLKTALKTTSSDSFHIINIELITKRQRPIEELVAITPMVFTTEQGYLLPEENQLLYVEERVKALLEKKYKLYYGEDIHLDQFAHSVEQISRKPIKIPYKNINLLGYKFKFGIDMSVEAQELATFALAVGLGEKTSLGCGYSLANFVRR